MDIINDYAFIQMEPNWGYELVEADDGASPAIWRIFREDDPSYEATIAEFWSGENDNEALCEEICAAHNKRVQEHSPQVLVVNDMGVELIINRRSDGKWVFAKQ